ncbi:gamma-glutamylcyclotransferase [Oceanobacillus manasiensis]|uniref:gamma-glutamylcyclotransferase n=1 Tax=Oceanobacillus manasiensis TaxID=586413 RepID=UPI0005A85E34|nr:gamma-glutamylcyclotransferase family protein [Oceanobacillus manasiensis]
MSLLFIYGDLRTDKTETLKKHATSIDEQVWVTGKLYDCNGSPYLVDDKDASTYGELVEISEENLEKLDEELNSERSNTSVSSSTDEQYNAFIYREEPNNEDKLEEVPFGDWKVYRYLKNETLYYFAYGSCMDDNRFKMANVDQYFTSIAGKGVLENYGFRFTRSSEDGGKADIIVSPLEKVEGVVYKVPLEAIDYLYKREGVYSKRYRPTIIKLTLNQGEEVDGITFVSVDKHTETKPTERYANEILRGASDILSPSYVARIRSHINHLLQ